MDTTNYNASRSGSGKENNMSQDLNHVILIGRCTRDATIKYTSGGMAIGSFSIAVNRRTKKGEQWVEEASFFDVSLFGKSAEGLAQYLTKGKQIAVEGELHQNRWQNEGKSMSKIEINAINVQLLGGNEKPAQQRGQGSGYQAQAEYSADNFPEDIPF